MERCKNGRTDRDAVEGGRLAWTQGTMALAPAGKYDSPVRRRRRCVLSLPLLQRLVRCVCRRVHFVEADRSGRSARTRETVQRFRPRTVVPRHRRPRWTAPSWSVHTAT